MWSPDGTPPPAGPRCWRSFLRSWDRKARVGEHSLGGRGLSGQVTELLAGVESVVPIFQIRKIFAALQGAARQWAEDAKFPVLRVA